MLYEPLGYYTDCDTAVCQDCATEEDAKDPYAVISYFAEPVDCPCHCAVCGELVDTGLTAEGKKYVREALLADDGAPAVLEQWLNAYGQTVGVTDVMLAWLRFKRSVPTDFANLLINQVFSVTLDTYREWAKLVKLEYGYIARESDESVLHRGAQLTIDL